MANKIENSDYCNEVESIKDSYMAVCSFFGEHLLYSYWTGWSNNLVDCAYILKSELCYESQDVRQGYSCRYIYNSQNMTDSAFCFASFNCTNCFMCVNLRNKQYCIRNTQYTKEEYEREMKKYNLGSHTTVEKIKREFWDFAKTFPRRFAYITNSEDCIGDHIENSKNLYWGFDTFDHENTSYVFDSGTAKDSQDLLQSGIDCSLIYETQSLGWGYNIHFANWNWRGSDLEYVDACHDSHDLFGCVAMRKKRYCILNKQYSEKGHKELRKKIIEHMRKTGEYGEFFPITLSPHAYNETIAQQWYPKEKIEVQKNNWQWQGSLPGKFGPGTVAWNESNDDIANVGKEILKETLSCEHCTKNYKIVAPELAFYKKRGIPLPHKCPDCRFNERIALRNPRKLWHRQCMCSQKHSHHSRKPCPNEFETSYAPERKETIYCAECYNAEVI